MTPKPTVEQLLEKLPIYPVLSELLACLCTAVDDDACYCGLVVGDIPLDVAPVGGGDCGGTVAYVRIISSFTSQSFPTVDGTNQIGRRAYAIGVGIVRPAPIAPGNELPSADEETAFALAVLADHQVIWNAIRCCLNEEKFDTIQTAALTYTPLERSDVGGGEWTLQIQV